MIFFFKQFVIFGHFFLPFFFLKICCLSLFFRLTRWFTKLTLFKLRFLNLFSISMYTTETKLKENFTLIHEIWSPLPFFKNWKKVPKFWSKMP